MKLLRRLEALERELLAEAIILHMPDGRTETLPGHNGKALSLLARACRGDITPETELIARSMSSTEPGGAHLIDLARALLQGPDA